MNISWVLAHFIIFVLWHGFCMVHISFLPYVALSSHDLSRTHPCSLFHTLFLQGFSVPLDAYIRRCFSERRRWAHPKRKLCPSSYKRSEAHSLNSRLSVEATNRYTSSPDSRMPIMKILFGFKKIFLRVHNPTAESSSALSNENQRVIQWKSLKLND